MLERLLFTMIKTGITLTQENPDDLVEFFVDEGMMEEAEAVKLKDYFLAHVPNVIHGYATPQSQFPLYAITLTSDASGEQFIGNEGGFHSDDGDRHIDMDDWAEIRNYTINILVYANHPDIALFYFHLLKNFLIGQDDVFQNADYFDVMLMGADLSPDAVTAPAGLFLRRLQVDAKRQYTQPKIASKLNRAMRVSGLFVKKEGAVGEDNGGVESSVDTYTDDGGGGGDEEA